MISASVNPLSAHDLLNNGGALTIFLVLFAETGLLIGFFFPGDSLLFTAGLFCATSATGRVHLSLPLVLIAAVSGALLGAQTGYVIGRVAGPKFLDRPDRPRLHGAVVRARESLDRYGVGKAIVLARFIPLVRTVLNPLAGTIKVPVKTFVFWQCLGGIVWTVGVTLAGYQLGSSIPSIDRYLLPIIALIIAVSLIPVVLEYRRSRHEH